MRHLTRTRTRTRTLAVVGALALVVSLGACGGDDDDDGGGGGSSAPGNASEDDFCESFSGFFDEVVSKASDADPSDMIASLKEWAADMEDVGTPDEMPDDARRGFELFVDQAKEIDDDASLDDLQDLGKDFSSGDKEDAEAFSTWTTDNCPLDLPGAPVASHVPSDLPSEVSALPSDLPSDLPTDPSELESMMSELTESAGG